MQDVQKERKKKKIKQSQMRRKEKNRERNSRSRTIERWAVNFGGAIGPWLVYSVHAFTIIYTPNFKYWVLSSCRA